MDNCNCINKIGDNFNYLVKSVMGKVGKFSLVDFTIMKICLSFAGMYLGIRFSSKLKSKAPFIGIIALFSYFFMIYKLFIEQEKLDK